MQRVPRAQGCGRGTPRGQWPRQGKRCSVRQCAAAGGELPAGIILRCAAGNRRRASPGGSAVPLPARDGRWVCVVSQKAVLAMLAGAKILGRLSKVSSSRR